MLAASRSRLARRGHRRGRDGVDVERALSRAGLRAGPAARRAQARRTRNLVDGSWTRTVTAQGSARARSEQCGTRPRGSGTASQPGPYEKALVLQRDGAFDPRSFPSRFPGGKARQPSSTKTKTPRETKSRFAAKLEPAFSLAGRSPAGNASKLNERRGLYRRVRRRARSELGAKPIARIVAQAQVRARTGRSSRRPKGARIERCLKKAGWSIDDVGSLRGETRPLGGIECVPPASSTPRSEIQT